MNWCLLYGFAFMVVLWELLLEKKLQDGIDYSIKTTSICDDFKIWWRKNDGSYSLMQLAKHLLNASNLPVSNSLYFICTDQQLEEQLRHTQC
jgi:hypothetical protein